MDVIFLVPEGYKRVGGMYLPISHYKEYLDNNGMPVAAIIEIPYHKDVSFNGIYEELNEIISSGEHCVFGFTLNICYAMLHDFKLHKNERTRCVCFLVDSMALNMDSVLKYERWGHAYLEHKLRFALYKEKEKFCLKHCKNVIYVSPVDKQYVLEHFSNSITGDVWVIPNGIDLPVIEYVQDRVPAPLVLGALTGFSKETLNNNLYPFLNEIFPNIVQVFPDIKFVIAGRGANPETVQDLQSRPNVQYIGAVGNLIEFYSKVDVVVTTVKKECGIINRILEAWAYKKINIGFRRNFVAFEHAEADIHYIPADTPEEFTAAVQKLTASQELIREMGNKGYELAKDEYAWHRSGRLLLQIIQWK